MSRATGKPNSRMVRKRVIFRFGGETEAYHSPELPVVGDRASHGDALWVVTRVVHVRSGAVAVCERSWRESSAATNVRALRGRR